MPGPRSALILIVAALALGACGSDGDGASSTAPVGGSGQVSCEYREGGLPSKPVQLPPRTPDAAAPTRMLISTNAGDVPVIFDTDAAPCTVNSFISLARQGYFNNTRCHRLTTDGIYVLQCGDPSASGSGGPGYTIADELLADDSRLEPCNPGTGACTYADGYLAMANTGTEHSGGSQFFLIYRDSPLPPEYTVFGHTNAAGLKVLQEIGAGGTVDGSGDGAPKETVTIASVR